MDDRYIIPLPDFKYDHQALFDVQDNNENYVANPHFKKSRNLDTSKDNLFSDFFNPSSPVIEEIKNKFNFKTDCKFTKVLAGGVLPSHIDPKRTAVVMFPITDGPSPIVYYDENKNKLFEYIYTGVTLINAKIEHGVPVNKSDRIFFQVNSYLPWEQLVTMYKENTLYEQ
jgi:hypothetical protein